MNQPVDLILLRMGFAEDSYASFMAIHNWEREPFHSGIAAVENLAICYFIKFLEGQPPWDYPNKCCVDYKQRSNPSDRFCPTCGSQLGYVFHLDEFTSYLKELPTLPLCGGYGEGLESLGCWTEFPSFENLRSVPPGHVLEFKSHAEVILTMALYDTMLDEYEAVSDDMRQMFRDAIKRFWEAPPRLPYGGDPQTREELAELLETHYRASKE